MDEFNKISEYEANVQKTIIFLCTWNEQWEIKKFKTIYNNIKNMKCLDVNNTCL